MQARVEFDQTIQETEAAYMKILESSAVRCCGRREWGKGWCAFPPAAWLTPCASADAPQRPQARVDELNEEALVVSPTRSAHIFDPMCSMSGSLSCELRAAVVAAQRFVSTVVFICSTIATELNRGPRHKGAQAAVDGMLRGAACCVSAPRAPP